MANLITVPILKCITGWFFTITQEVVVANTLFSLDLSLYFFDDAKRGKINLTKLTVRENLARTQFTPLLCLVL